MRSQFIERSHEADVPAIRLNGIWYVDADDTYNVSRRKAPPRDFIAVRTLTGCGKLELHDGTSLMLEPNSIVLLNGPDIAHYATARDKWEFYWFRFSAVDWRPDSLSRVLFVPVSTQERVELERCFLNLSRGSMCESMIAQSLFSYLLADWLVHSEDSVQSGASHQQILSLLETGRREHISIPELARKAGMCERSFRNAVKEAAGLSPKAYMLRGEMAAAMELLRTTDMSVSEIAACLDYTSPFYFSRVFKKYYGISPQYVREEIRL